MRIKPKEVKRTVGILTDPQPNWTAFVDHGANQTPWNSVKRDGEQGEPRPLSSYEPAEQEILMAIKTGKGAKRQPVVTRITFSKSQFPTQADVQKWMDEKGFDGFELGDDNDVWAAKSTEDTSKLTLGKSVSTPAKDAGVFVHIAEVQGEQADTTPADKRAKVKTPVEGEEGATEGTDEEGVSTKADGPNDQEDNDEGDDVSTDVVLTFPEASKKFDIWGAYMSESGSLMGVLKDGMGYDSVPPGVDEVLTAVYLTTGNILSGKVEGTDKKTAMKQLGEDFATLVLGLDELFGGVDTTKGSDAAKAAKAAWIDSIERAASVVSDNVIRAAQTEQTADEPITTEEPTQEPTAGDESESAVMKFLREELAPKIDAAVKTAEEAKVAAAEATTTAKQVSARAPTRKSLSEGVDDILDPANARKALDTATQQDTADRVSMYKGFFGGVGGGKSH